MTDAQSRSFVDWAVLPLRRYIQNGRSCRAEFWWFQLFTTVVSNLLTLMSEGLEWYGSDEMGVVDVAGGWPALIFTVATFVPLITVSIRRLHDTDRSAWSLLLFVPILGWLALLVSFVMEGTRGRNRFGPDPLRPPEVDPAVFA